MKIIDFEKKGQSVRFYLGDEDTTDYFGDDWDDVPYEHNAGTVYPEYVKGYTDVTFPFDDLVLEPCDGETNSDYCKYDMRNNLVPCIIVIPAEKRDTWHDEFSYYLGMRDKKAFYFGDQMEPQNLGTPAQRYC